MRCNAMNPNYVSYNIISFTKSINQREDLQRSWCSEQQGPIDMSSLIPARQALDHGRPLAHCHWHWHSTTVSHCSRWRGLVALLVVVFILALLLFPSVVCGLVPYRARWVNRTVGWMAGWLNKNQVSHCLGVPFLAHQ